MSRFGAAVIGVGNRFRGDDGVGSAVVERLSAHDLPGVRIVGTDGEPTALLEAWSGVDLAVVVDAVRYDPSSPGRIHRTDLRRAPRPAAVRASSHGLGLLDALALARALDRAPARLVVYLVEVADLGYGTALSPAVRDALPQVTEAVLSELGRASGELPWT